jgi:hypothetical protein
MERVRAVPVTLKINMEQARLNPSCTFGSPTEIAGEAAFTLGQKIATLVRWRLEILDHFAATSEGMPSNRTGEADMATLAKIDDVVASLLAFDEPERLQKVQRVSHPRCT